jgi:hypothetical protein
MDIAFWLLMICIVEGVTLIWLGIQNIRERGMLERVRELPDSWRRDIHHPLDELRTFGSDHQAPWQLQDAWLRGEAALLNCIDDLTKALGEDK